jgi:hypothetical protein
MQDENGAAATKNERFGQDGRGGGALTNSNQLRDEGWPDKHPYQVRVAYHNYADGVPSPSGGPTFPHSFFKRSRGLVPPPF